MLGWEAFLDLSTWPETSYPAPAGHDDEEGWPDGSAGGVPCDLL